jgi:enoyl-CoA hydratase
VRSTITGPIAQIMLTNPPLNVLNRRLHEELSDLCDAIGTNDSVRAVVLTGEGNRAFSAGADINESAEERGSPEVTARLRFECDVYDKIEALPQPIVAAIKGYALGGGLEMTLSCDFRIAGTSAKFGLPEVKLGMFPASGGLYRLPRLIGEAQAKMLAYLGEMIDAPTALQMGLVDEVVADDDVVDRAAQLALRLAERSPLAVRTIKSILHRERELSQVDSMQLIVDAATAVINGGDAGQALRRFRDRS